MRKSQSDPVAFWNRLASTYPRYSATAAYYEEKILAAAGELGLSLKDSVILDVGCGTGMFTLHLAKLAKKVIGIDISPKMLDYLRLDLEREHIKNVAAVLSDWLDFQTEEIFDLLFFSMSPALFSREGCEKALTFSGARVFATLPDGDFASRIAKALFQRYGIKPEPFDRPGLLYALLKERNLEAASTVVSGVWRVSLSREEILESAGCSLYNHGLEPDAEELEGFLSPFKGEDGRYVEETAYRIRLFLWRNP
ncbi:MAG: class I SAM-dependent methyltransferase [Deltaproteobacteria bacterium]|jgi:SAM-dependent methyltransferase|nr:class I SAM-dependent methyltransferase [Deltaproteobacteria bacterium]